ncbi:hypothetical protein OPW39_16370 [Vibrio europaeus]|nr:hypothetical protein [Vibrio europaeus]MDC5870382.1 hypothetical protein [Vibrio europaeus]
MQLIFVSLTYLCEQVFNREKYKVLSLVKFKGNPHLEQALNVVCA